VLKLVYEESHKILALSEHSFGFRELKNVHQTKALMEGWQKEGLALLNAIQSLKDYLSKVADRGDKVRQERWLPPFKNCLTFFVRIYVCMCIHCVYYYMCLHIYVGGTRGLILRFEEDSQMPWVCLNL